MKKSEKNIQIILILTGIFLILITYFYYPYSKKNKLVDNQDIKNNKIIVQDENEDTFFENVEYNGIYDFDKTFKVKSEKARILKDDPDIVHMTKMEVDLYLSDGRIVKIISDKGRYNKISYDCFFENNVKATDGDVKILSDNLDLLATDNSVKIYNDVNINYPAGSLRADKIDYDFETKYFKVSMFDNEKLIKMKLLK